MDDPRDRAAARGSAPRQDDGTRRGMLALGAPGGGERTAEPLTIEAPRAAEADAASHAPTADAAPPRDAATLERELTTLSGRLAAAEARASTLGEQLASTERQLAEAATQLAETGTQLGQAEAALAAERAARVQRDGVLERLQGLVAQATADREGLAAELRDARAGARDQEALASAYAARGSAARECVDGYRRALAFAVQLEPFAASEPLVAAEGSRECALR